ncbi:MAG TPA: hypothetical protein VF989_20235 [Polyangiaceae bacterium]
MAQSAGASPEASDASRERLRSVLYGLLRCLFHAGRQLHPFLPVAAERLLHAVGASAPFSDEPVPATPLARSAPLFPKWKDPP